MKRTDKWSLTSFKSILKISLSNYLQFFSNLSVKFPTFLKVAYFLVVYIVFSVHKHNCNGSITDKLEQLCVWRYPCFLSSVKAVICLVLCNLHHCIFKKEEFFASCIAFYVTLLVYHSLHFAWRYLSISYKSEKLPFNLQVFLMKTQTHKD